VYFHFRLYLLFTGISLPLFYVLLGEMIDQLNVGDAKGYARATRPLCLSFLSIGCITLVSGFLQVNIFAAWKLSVLRRDLRVTDLTTRCAAGRTWASTSHKPTGRRTWGPS
jgi:hypothetical protein